MLSLDQRINMVMADTGWSVSEMASIAGVTQSAVSQWLGKGSKPITKLQNIEAVLKLSQQAGVEPLWLATGKGPRHAVFHRDVHGVSDRLVSYSIDWPFSVPRHQFDLLSMADKARIDDYIKLVAQSASPGHGHGQPTV